MTRVVGMSFPKFSAEATVKKATTGSESPRQFTMADFGADTASVLKEQGGSRSDFVIPTIVGTERPSNMWFNGSDSTACWNYYRLMDQYRAEVSVMSTVIHRSATELTRYGLELVPRFVKKCMECGYESKSAIHVCPQCESKRLRRPEDAQKKYFRRPNGKSFLDEANASHQTMKDVIRCYSESQYLYNQCFTVCVTGDMIDPKTGQLILDANGNPRQYPHEFICVDPKFVKILYDDTGKPGTQYGFTMKNRNLIFSRGGDGVLRSVPNGDGKVEVSKDGYHAPDGSVLYPAEYQIGSNYGGTGNYLLYTGEEVYQDKWFRQSMTYGVPIWLDIEDDLLTYHFIEKHNLKKYEYGYVRKILILPGFSQKDARVIANGVQDVLASNDNSIPIICLPPQLPNTPEMKAQSIELGTESSGDLMQVKNDIRDRICSFIGVPNMFVGDVENGGGMNNESQQITTFDRYLMDKYDYLDRQLKWVLSWFPDITDFELRVARPSKADLEQKKRMEAIQEAQGMKSLGFKVRWVDGEFQYSEEPEAEPNVAAPLAPQNQGGPFGGNSGGIPKGANGQMKPDAEMNATKQELNNTQGDADDALLA